MVVGQVRVCVLTPVKESRYTHNNTNIMTDKTTVCVTLIYSLNVLVKRALTRAEVDLVLTLARE